VRGRGILSVAEAFLGQDDPDGAAECTLRESVSGFYPPVRYTLYVYICVACLTGKSFVVAVRVPSGVHLCD
jgi:hypothetical protein